MKLAVIGASAGTGLEIIRFALERGHGVVALARRPVPVPDQSNLVRLSGDACREVDVSRAVAGVDAVIVALGRGMNIGATTLFTDAGQVLIRVLGANGSTAPVVVLSGFGAGDSLNYTSPLKRFFFNLLLGRVYANKTAAEALFAASGLNWTIVRPGVLTNGPAKGVYRVLPELSVGMRVGSISRADVARFMVGEAEAPKHTGKYPVLTD